MPKGVYKRTNYHRAINRNGHLGKSLSIEQRKKIKSSMLARNVKGKDHHAWKGGRHKHKNKYVLVYCPTHPYHWKGGYIFEHRLVMETHIGRILLPTEIVHHLNSICDDNRIENLMLFSSASEHMKHHIKIRKELI